MRAWGEVLHGGPTAESDLHDLEHKLFIIGSADQQDRLVRFFVMLGLSAAIATGGILSDSTAVVIGAMIIAPLMTPILGSALAIATARGGQFLREISVVAVGVVFVMCIAMLIALPDLALFDLEENGQITSRVHPNLVDMGVALASGLAGAFAVSRTQVADALPGVAISISLVPPLAAAAVSIVHGHGSFALGALLLFATNLVAILAAGSFVFLLFGYGRLAVEESHETDRRRGLALIAGFMAALLVPLGVASYNVAQHHLLQTRAAKAVDAWISETQWEPVDVTVIGRSQANVVLGGSGERPDVDALVDRVEQETGRDVTIRIEYVPIERTTVG